MRWNPVVSSVIILLLFSNFPSALAQPPALAENEKMGEALSRHTRSVSSELDFSAVPIHHAYRAVFMNVLFNEGLAAKFTEKDWDIISNLPAHSDRKFREFSDRSISRACRNIKSERSSNSASASRAATHYSNSKQEIDEHLNRHYRQVMRKLSRHGRSIVQSELEKMEGSSSIMQSKLDVAGMSVEDPEVTLEFLKLSCRSHDERDNKGKYEDRLLIDVLSRSYDDGSMLIYDASQAR